MPTLLVSRGILGERASAFYLAFWIVFAIGVGATYGALIGEPNRGKGEMGRASYRPLSRR